MLSLIDSILFFAVITPFLNDSYSDVIKSRAEQSYSYVGDTNFDLNYTEFRWINDTKITIYWGMPRDKNASLRGYFLYSLETGIRSIFIRIDLSERDKKEVFAHEYCHLKQHENYYANPPRNQLYLSERYMREQEWEEECYAAGIKARAPEKVTVLRHLQLVKEYVGRHSLAIPQDYYGEYPETAWIRQYVE